MLEPYDLHILECIGTITNIIFKYTAMECFYHPGNQLQNLCVRKECAVPLCPKCINIHIGQSQHKHHLMSLADALQMISEQLYTSSKALKHELDVVKLTYLPENILKDYYGLLEKYRLEAIAVVNTHYYYLKKYILFDLTSKYNRHIVGLVTPLVDHYASIDKYRSAMLEESTKLKVAIEVVAQDEIKIIEDFLATLENRKKDFKASLPLLNNGPNGQLQIVEPVTYVYPVVVKPKLVSYEVSGVDRIAYLYNRLMLLRQPGNY